MIISTDWIDIKEYEGIYQVLYTGKIRRILKNGYRELSVFLKKGRKCPHYVVHLTDINGNRKEINIAKIMAENYIGKCPQGYVPYHINGMQNDNYYTNIAYISRQKLGQITSYKANSKRVARIDKYGEITDVYRSARDCANKVNSNRQTITDCCNGDRKKPFNKDFDFAWEEDTLSIRKAIQRLNSKPKSYKGIRCRKVYVFDKDNNLINQFNSMADTSRKMFYSYGFISECCHGLKNCNDYRFSFNRLESESK